MSEFSNSEGRALFQKQRRIAVYLILAMGMILVASTLWKRYFLSTNPASRIITVERLLEAGTFAHWSPNDSTPFERSIDVIKVGDKVYSSKPPNYALLMTAESAVIKGVTGWGFYPHRRDYVRILTLVNQVIPFLFMLYVVFLFLREFTQNNWTLYFMLLAMGLGSLPFAYASTINNHTVAVYLFVFGFYWVYQLTHKRKGKGWEYLLLGVILGFAVSIELPGAAFAAGLIFLLARHNWRKTLWVLVGILIPFIPMLVVFKLISGSWKPFYFQGDLYRFEGSYWKKPEGLDALNEGKLKYLFQILVGYKGIFMVTPLLALGLWGAIKHLLRKGNPMAATWWTMMAGIVAVFLFVWLRTKNYGGDCIGLRWMIVAMPFLMLMAWPVVERLGRSWLGKGVCILLLLLALPHVYEALLHDAYINGWLQELWGALFR
jgi:hypothetical protein